MLRIPRLTEKYRETLKSIERKEVLDQYCIDQFKPLDAVNMSRDDYCNLALNSALQLQLGQVINIKTSNQFPEENIKSQQQSTNLNTQDAHSVFITFQQKKRVASAYIQGDRKRKLNKKNITITSNESLNPVTIPNSKSKLGESHNFSKENIFSPGNRQRNMRNRILNRSCLYEDWRSGAYFNTSLSKLEMKGRKIK